MDAPGEMIRKHHRELAAEMTQHVAALMDAPSENNIAALVQFLTHELLPHARGEEQALYPAVEPLLKAHGRATATMSIDHEAIEGYVHRIEDAARARMQAADDERAARDAELVQLLLQLQAIFKLHLLQS
jgi:iron-sulfur cluster repair protein YtfE (RIC family)